MKALTDDPLNILKEFITELANITYKEDGEGLLLSRVGEIISQQRPELRDALGSKKLAEFIEQELSESVHILMSPENHIVRVILPAGVVVKDDPMQFFPKRSTERASANEPRYSRAFWAAFTRPLAEGYTRLVGFDPQVHYEDITGDVPPTTTKKVVPNDSIVDEVKEPVPAKRVNRINEKVNDWLAANDVPVDIVEARSGKEHASIRTTESHKGSLLEVLLATLGDTDLKRIQMPLDVVAKLHRHL